MLMKKHLDDGRNVLNVREDYKIFSKSYSTLNRLLNYLQHQYGRARHTMHGIAV